MAKYNSNHSKPDDDSLSSLFEVDKSFNFEEEFSRMLKKENPILDEIKHKLLNRSLESGEITKDAIQSESIKLGLSQEETDDLQKYLEDCGIRIIDHNDFKGNSNASETIAIMISEDDDNHLVDLANDTSNTNDTFSEDDSLEIADNDFINENLFTDNSFEEILNQETDEKVQSDIEATISAEVETSQAQSFDHEKNACLQDQLRWYLDQINKYPSINSSSEEAEYFQRIERGDQQAKEEFICRNLRLVYSVAKKYMHYGLSLLDLIQEGNLGLCTATERFNYRLGNKFSTYAIWWIRQAISRAIADKSNIVRIPVHLYEKIAKVKQAVFKLEKQLNHEPSNEEISKFLNGEYSTNTIQYLLTFTNPPISIDTNSIFKDKDGSTTGDYFPMGNVSYEFSINDIVDERENPELFAEKELIRDRIEKFISSLSPREQQIIIMRFGLDGKGIRTLEVIGKDLKLTRERIRQLEKRCLRKMQIALKGINTNYYR